MTLFLKPRRLRSLVSRIFGVIVVVTFVYVIFPRKQSTFQSKQLDIIDDSGKNNQLAPNEVLVLERNENYLESIDSEKIAVVPISPDQHSKIDESVERNVELQAVKVFTEKPMLNEQSNEFYTEEELVTWRKKPISKPSEPGAYGKPYKISNPSNAQSQLIKEGWEKHAFNQYICDKISLHRYLGDKREQECKIQKWRKPLPTTSVVIVFHNEAWCSLLRTVYSVLETSPKILLKEILLVDDASTHDELHNNLDEYVKQLEVVRVIRSKERIGLIRARLLGAAAAMGDVLTFLDAHCECVDNWLQPLLTRIAEDPKKVVCPVIEVIDADTFAMGITRGSSVQLGIMGWNLGFNWGVQKNRPDDLPGDQPLKSPTMAGGLFSMSKSYFYFLGSYDDKMQVWGGENIEMSLRIWMCGGTLEIHPCSHVGHVFRKRAPYTHPGGSDVITRNNRRVAEVWMDDYKEQYYKRVSRAKKVDPGDISERVQLRKDLGCKSFSWFIMNVYPDLYAPPKEDILKSGEWANEDRENKFCMDSANPEGKVGFKITMYPCHGLGANQEFILTRQGEIRHNFVKELCLQPDSRSAIVAVLCKYPQETVPVEQIWEYTKNMQFRHVRSDRCMEAMESRVELKPCVLTLSQIWRYRQLANTAR